MKEFQLCPTMHAALPDTTPHIQLIEKVLSDEDQLVYTPNVIQGIEDIVEKIITNIRAEIVGEISRLLIWLTNVCIKIRIHENMDNILSEMEKNPILKNFEALARIIVECRTNIQELRDGDEKRRLQDQLKQRVRIGPLPPMNPS